MTLRVSDLPECPKHGVALYCPECSEKFSAVRGDYFAASPDTELVHCDYDMALVQEQGHLRVIRPQEAEDTKEGGEHA